MKKVKNWSSTTLFVMLLTLLGACGDDEGDKNGNTTDIAITGSCVEVGGDYACIEGYFNQKNVTASYSSLQIGIEYSDNESFKSSKFVQSKVLEGNKFEVKITGLKQLTDYYYRTCVKINALNYVGKTSKFTTLKGEETNKQYKLTVTLDITDKGPLTDAQCDAMRADAQKGNTVADHPTDASAETATMRAAQAISEALVLYKETYGNAKFVYTLVCTKVSSGKQIITYYVDYNAGDIRYYNNKN